MKQPEPADGNTAGLLAGITSILADFEVADGSPALGDPSRDGRSSVKDIFAVSKRKAWDKTTEARCNFTFRPRITPRAGLWFLSLWQKSLMGRTLSEIKSDPAEIPHFAEAVSDFLISYLGTAISAGHWCICTSPKRRHKEHNFATLICRQIGERLQIPFYEDVAICRSRQRINAVFTLNILPAEPNVIVFDDFVTTGSTLRGMHELLLAHGRNTLFVAGINNKL
ncbi:MULTISPECIES: hypothetical protein [Duncaniella]|uniref:Phosphoribosyltransferase n=1 Tax=Duncaniella dubosii TaxID=2518971 RepID=A0A4P7W2S9_9BACT|nr:MULTISPECIES: hypothetical protein [Duncaniella]MBJ2190571.1 hypothetical protein [Muribaculaceae bacterium]MCX4285343.1 hypothetical protein [Duncaniella dubosii]QCD42177.1 hypothetical protein E7747_07760 [Duncaniella dubosii]HBN63033.1 hypothetical protein [Porphyromonadaceae bacterium]